MFIIHAPSCALLFVASYREIWSAVRSANCLMVAAAALRMVARFITRPRGCADALEEASGAGGASRRSSSVSGDSMSV